MTEEIKNSQEAPLDPIRPEDIVSAPWPVCFRLANDVEKPKVQKVPQAPGPKNIVPAPWPISFKIIGDE